MRDYALKRGMGLLLSLIPVLTLPITLSNVDVFELSELD